MEIRHEGGRGRDLNSSIPKKLSQPLLLRILRVHGNREKRFVNQVARTHVFQKWNILARSKFALRAIPVCPPLELRNLERNRSIKKENSYRPPNNMARDRTLRRAMTTASAKMPRRWCIRLGVMTDRSSETQNAPTPPMSAPGGLARRLWDHASANHMPATSMRRHSPPNNMALCRTLRRAMASASAKMPRRLCILGVMTDRKFRDTECADIAYVGASRPCTALLGRRVRKWYARDVNAQTFAA